MARTVAAGMKAAWEAAKKDFKETAGTDALKQDVRDVIDIAKSQASRISRKSQQAASASSRAKSSGSKVGPRVNQDVGSELLTHFKEEWGEIHHSTEEAAKMATKVDTDLKRLNQSVTKSHVIIGRCQEEFTHLREVVEALDEAQSKVEAISGLIVKVEEELSKYSEAKAELLTERQKHSLQRQHEKDIVEKRTKIEHLRKVLLNEQRLSLSVKQEMEKQALKERQQAFQDLFDKQMSDYRTRGEVSQPIGEVRDLRERSSSHLEEIVIEDEDGTASLHEFLSDVVLEEGSREVGGGGKGEEEEEVGEGSQTQEQEATQKVTQVEDTPTNLN